MFSLFFRNSKAGALTTRASSFVAWVAEVVALSIFFPCRDLIVLIPIKLQAGLISGTTC